MDTRLIKEKEHKNGDSTWTFDCDKEFKEAVKAKYGKKRYSDKIGKIFIIETLHRALVDNTLKELDEALTQAYKINNIKR